MCTDNYVVNSLELHLFFGRIMKEHSLFLMAGFTPANVSFSKQAEFYKREFEKVLCRAIALRRTDYGTYFFGRKTDGTFYWNPNQQADNQPGITVTQG